MLVYNVLVRMIEIRAFQLDMHKLNTIWLCLYCGNVASNSDDCFHGQLRLVGGSSEKEGRVEICYDNQWGTICDNGWSNEEAKVVCRQLGFQTIGGWLHKTCMYVCQ